MSFLSLVACLLLLVIVCIVCTCFIVACYSVYFIACFLYVQGTRVILIVHAFYCCVGIIIRACIVLCIVRACIVVCY